jgi:hypothetical protein
LSELARELRTNSRNGIYIHEVGYVTINQETKKPKQDDMVPHHSRSDERNEVRKRAARTGNPTARCVCKSKPLFGRHTQSVIFVLSFVLSFLSFLFH